MAANTAAPPQLPTVTIASTISHHLCVQAQTSDFRPQEDLKRYHAAHFPGTDTPSITTESFHAPSPAAHTGAHPTDAGDYEAYDDGDYDEVDDDGLGYYPDGTKRTLTDAQVAMFRHSEIQALLRERRLRREEAGSDAEGAAGRVEPRDTTAAAVGAATGRSGARFGAGGINAGAGAGGGKKRRKKNRKPRPGKGERSAPRTGAGEGQQGGGEDEDGEESLMRHHKARVLASLDEQPDTQGGDKDYTPRRLARELDEVEHADVEIDYG